MWYFETSEPVTVVTGGAAREYSSDQFHDETVWGDPFWRESGEAQQAFFRCYEAVHGQKRVTLSDEDFEKYKPIATLRGKTIPLYAFQVNRLIAPIFAATKKRPDHWAAQDGKASTVDAEPS